MEHDHPDAEKDAKDLAAGLAPIPLAAREAALNHPVRRRILQTLIERDEPQSAIDLMPPVMEIVDTATVGSVNYHAQMLERSGNVIRMGMRHTPGSLSPLYASNVTDDRILALL